MHHISRIDRNRFAAEYPCPMSTRCSFRPIRICYCVWFRNTLLATHHHYIVRFVVLINSILVCCLWTYFVTVIVNVRIYIYIYDNVAANNFETNQRIWRALLYIIDRRYIKQTDLQMLFAMVKEKGGKNDVRTIKKLSDKWHKHNGILSGKRPRVKVS